RARYGDMPAGNGHRTPRVGRAETDRADRGVATADEDAGRDRLRLGITAAREVDFRRRHRAARHLHETVANVRGQDALEIAGAGADDDARAGTGGPIDVARRAKIPPGDPELLRRRNRHRRWRQRTAGPDLHD